MIAQPGKASIHQEYLESLKTFIAKHNDNPGTRLKDKSELKNVTVLSTEQTTGGRFEAPDIEFVYIENWDEEKYGPYKPDQIKDEFIFGKWRKGVYKTRGQEGHIKFKQFQEHSLKTSTIENDGEGIFAEQAMQAQEQVTCHVMYGPSSSRPFCKHSAAIYQLHTAFCQHLTAFCQNPPPWYICNTVFS